MSGKSPARRGVNPQEALDLAQHARPQDRERAGPFRPRTSPAMPGTRRAKQIGLSAVRSRAALDLAPQHRGLVTMPEPAGRTGVTGWVSKGA